jgi:hypothetical protein
VWTFNVGVECRIRLSSAVSLTSRVNYAYIDSR